MMKNMSLRNKFAVKKTPPRRSLSLNNLNNLESSIREEHYGLNYDAPKIKIAGQEFKFDDENGMWTSEAGGSGVGQKEFLKMKKQNQGLQEENNLLKLKIELLLDMLAECTAEKHLLEKDLGEVSSYRGSRKK
ncbi:Protein chibby-like 1 [Holothuria leucospilota]|uniref:Protein chibby-like 1 n=1 Tax=Holothuria leucospilota TaxID=206669 RepID=A0A9Q1H9M0_HOLLE|nr:Protein chibby-like 1 [Holothuria leucospilota]